MDVVLSVIRLKKMRFYALHGVLEQEREVGANFVVNIALRVVSIDEALYDDRLEGTVNYASVYALVKQEMSIHSLLLEHVAGRIAQTLLKAFDKVVEVKVEVEKENPPLGGQCKSSSVTIRAKRDGESDARSSSVGAVEKAIKARRSCRKFLPEQIEESTLGALLDVATYAPTGHGAQSPVILAVQNEELKRTLARMNAEVLGAEGNPYYDAPTIVLVFAPQSCPTWHEDGCLVLGTMMLAAYAKGLAACWIHREREMFESVEGKELMLQMGLPEGLVGVGALSLGYAGGEPSEQKPRKEDYYRILK